MKVKITCKYLCVITSNNHHGREFYTDTTSAKKCGYRYGYADGGEKITVKRVKSQKVISAAIWDVSRRKYISVYF